VGEVLALKQAVGRHGRAWAAVSRDVGTKSYDQCRGKVEIEVAAGRMQAREAGANRADSWNVAELLALKQAGWAGMVATGPRSRATSAAGRAVGAS
jgi:hypothetical protein